MPTTPGWKAAENGFSNNMEAINHAAQLGQFLGTHGTIPVYQGNTLIGPGTTWPASIGSPNLTWLTYGTSTDLSQPFVMSGTTLGRVQIPINTVGNGADLLVSLYPDSSGSPNLSNRLAATMVPASHLLNLTAPTGVSSSEPLATGRFNGLLPTGGFKQTVFAPPSSGTFAASTSGSTATSGNYIITAGGTTSGGTQGLVLTTQFTGNGTIALPVQQPSLPQSSYLAAFAAAGSTIVIAGGFFSNGTTITDLSSVYTASWDSNTGSIGSWSAQTSLPQTLWSPGCAATPTAVYVIGGVNNAGVIVNTVYWAVINNGQISAWNVGPTYPLTVSGSAVAVINGYLVVVGGQNTAGSSNATSSMYFSKIAANGSLGAWQVGPSHPLTGGWTYGTNGSNWGFSTTSNQLVTLGGSTVVSIGGTPSFIATDAVASVTVTADGPADSWTMCNNSNNGASGNAQWGLFPIGQGQYGAVGLDFGAQLYYSLTLTPDPWISVPLYASGLTNGATYHVVIQQRPSSSTSDYLQYGIMTASMPLDAKKSTRHSGTWTTITTGMSVPMIISDNTPGKSVNQVWHTWEDPSNTGSSASSNLALRHSTLIRATATPQLLRGVADAVTLPNDPLNRNPTFTTGVTNWTPHNCTFTQSNAQVHGGFSFSGLMTPSGATASCNVTSDLVPIASSSLPSSSTGQWYMLNGWFYSPTGWSNISLSVDWYDSAQGYMTTSNNTTSITAATWTNLVNYYQPPAGAEYASINLIEAGTPAASNTVYLSNVMIVMSNEMTQTVSDVAQITYNGVWPASGVQRLS